MAVDIHPGTDSLYRNWEREATHRQQNVLDMFASKYNHKFNSEQDVKRFLQPILQHKAEEMAQFLSAGVPINPYKQNRVQVKADVPVTPVVRGSTKAAIAPHIKDAEVARQELHQAITESIPDDRIRAQLEDFYAKQGFQPLEKYALLWTRTSGRTSAAAPHLDTNPAMLAQTMVSIRRIDPGRKLVLIGDPVSIPAKVRDTVVPHPDMNLIQYWEGKQWPADRSDISAQTFFLALIQSHHPKTVSVGTNSGILELPHLMGMRTLYLENKDDHPRKGLRWEKKHVLHDIDRVSTSASTVQWGQKQVLYEELREWMQKDIPKQSTGGVGWPGMHNNLLRKLVALTDMSHQAPKSSDASSSRPFSQQLGTVQSGFAKASNQPFRGSSKLRSQAIEAMESSTMRDGFTEQEVKNLEEVLGKYKGKDATDLRDLTGKWLKASETKWQEILVEQQRETREVQPANGTDTDLPPASVAHRSRSVSLPTPPSSPPQVQTSASKEV